MAFGFLSFFFKVTPRGHILRGESAASKIPEKGRVSGATR
jgi:hypothetical protein